MRTRIVSVLALCAALAGCAGAVDRDSIESADAELFVSSPRLWEKLSIPVCWDNPPAQQSQEMTWVREAVTNTWQANSLLKFTGWITCASPTTPGIHIKRITSGTPFTQGMGIELDGAAAGMQLNLTKSYNCRDFIYGDGISQVLGVPDAREPEFCVRAQAVHEFGHAIGIDHEHNRPPANFVCPTDSLVRGDIETEVWDPTSIMNYCNFQWGNAKLSAGDINGLHQFYGDPNNAALRQEGYVWSYRNDATSPTGKRADTAFVFTGSQYTRFIDIDNKTSNFYPRPVSLGWAGWPAAWSDGVDAIVDYGDDRLYMFRGLDYIRYSKSQDKVTQSPLGVIGRWPGFPTTWTGVDAAVNWGDGGIYMFRGSQYLKYNIAQDRVTIAPKPIAGNWKGVNFSKIEYVLNWGNGVYYFFSGSQYCRFDRAKDTCAAARPILGNWDGIPF